MLLYRCLWYDLGDLHLPSSCSSVSPSPPPRPPRRGLLALGFASSLLTLGTFVSGCPGEETGSPTEDFDVTSVPQEDVRPSDDVTVVPSDAAAACDEHCATDLGAAGSHACVRTGTGKLLCWGSNSLMQALGVAAPVKVTTPTEVPGIGNVLSFALGGFHTCAINAASEVWCWGFNQDGQLGSAAGSPGLPTKVVVSSISSKPVQVSAGLFHTCIRYQSGQVACFGWNLMGQSGTGTVSGSQVTPMRSIPVVLGIGNVNDMVLGGSTSCVYVATGVQCFGSNIFGQLGRGTVLPEVDPKPGALAGIDMGIKTFPSSQGSHFVVVLQNGSMRAWGSNQSGELGTGSAGPDVVTPTSVTAATDVLSASAGANATCVVMKDKTVRCFGRNNFFQSGAENDGGMVVGPQKVVGLENIAQISAGSNGACARTEAGQVYCWGTNEYGLLANGTTTGRSGKPVRIAF